MLFVLLRENAPRRTALQLEHISLWTNFEFDVVVFVEEKTGPKGMWYQPSDQGQVDSTLLNLAAVCIQNGPKSRIY